MKRICGERLTIAAGGDWQGPHKFSVSAQDGKLCHNNDLKPVTRWSDGLRPEEILKSLLPGFKHLKVGTGL